MPAQSLITRYIQTLIRTADSAGWGARAICEKAGMRLEDALAGNVSFAPEQLGVVVREIAARDDYLGQMPGVQRHGTFALMAELVIPSENLGAALRRGCRYYDMLSEDQSFHLRVEGERAIIEFALADPKADPDNLLKEWWARMWHRFAGWLVDQPIPLREVSFAHANKGPISEYVEVFHCPCRFQQSHNRLVFDAAWLAQPIARHVDELPDYLNFSRLDLVSLPGGSATLEQQIHHTLHEYFLCNREFPSIERVASELFVSSQTLRRRLAEAGTSFREIKNDIRRELVTHYLTIRRIPIAEVARLGGFAEPGGLSRAVRAWYGVSPRTYRQRHEAALGRAARNV